MATPERREPLTTPDGRYIVVRGRLWRRSDPGLSPDRRQSLVDRLMAARQAVRTALAHDDADALRAARAEVQAAKVALGERGTPWWEQSDAEREARWSATVPVPAPHPDR